MCYLQSADAISPVYIGKITITTPHPKPWRNLAMYIDTMSLVNIKIMNDVTKNNAFRSSDDFRPISPGSGAKTMGPTSPPIGRMLPIQLSCSSDGM